MNTIRQYWDMLVKDPSGAGECYENILHNVQGDKIVGFSKKNGTEFLSNFHPATVAFDGVLYPTVEHAYQASKTLDAKIRELIKKSNSPAEAKKLGRAVSLRQDWVDVRVNIMKGLIQEKFQNPFLQHLLLLTGNKELIHENRWNDKFWGVTNGVGENWLGRIIEEVRKEIVTENETF